MLPFDQGDLHSIVGILYLFIYILHQNFQGHSLFLSCLYQLLSHKKIKILITSFSCIFVSGQNSLECLNLVSSCITSWESSHSDFGLTILFNHLESARKITEGKNRRCFRLVYIYFFFFSSKNWVQYAFCRHFRHTSLTALRKLKIKSPILMKLIFLEKCRSMI